MALYKGNIWVRAFLSPGVNSFDAGGSLILICRPLVRIQSGSPFLTAAQSGEHVEGSSQGISEGWAFERQVRKGEPDERPLFGVIRTFKEVRRFGCQQKQAGQRHFELAVGLVASLELLADLPLTLGDLAVLAIENQGLCRLQSGRHPSRHCGAHPLSDNEDSLAVRSPLGCSRGLSKSRVATLPGAQTSRDTFAVIACFTSSAEMEKLSHPGRGTGS